MRNRTTPAASSASAGSVSNSSSTTRTAASGTIAITSCGPSRHTAQGRFDRLADRLPLAQIASTRSGITLPGASSRAAHASSVRPSSASRPTSTRSAAISQASLGFWRVRSRVHLRNSLPSFILLQFNRPATRNAIAGRELPQWSEGSGQLIRKVFDPAAQTG